MESFESRHIKAPLNVGSSSKSRSYVLMFIAKKRQMTFLQPIHLRRSLFLCVTLTKQHTPYLVPEQ